MDNQPFAPAFALMAVIAISMESRLLIGITKSIVLFILASVYSMVISVMCGSFSLRGCGAYASCAVVTCAAYQIHRRRLFRVWMLTAAITIWGLFGLIQTFIYRGFGLWILPELRSSHDRGVVGLAPEPAIYGLVCLFMLALIYLIRKSYPIPRDTQRFLIASLLVQIVVFAQSALVIFLVLLSALVLMLSRLTFRKALLTCLCAGSVVLLSPLAIEKLAGQFRLLTLLRTAMDTPELLYIADGSINIRVADIVVSSRSLVEQLPFAFGHGTDAWPTYSNQVASKYPTFLNLRDSSSRINSAFGMGLFELGYVGLIFPIVTVVSMARHRDRNLRLLGILVVAWMFSEGTLSFPLYGLLIGSSEALRPDSQAKAPRLMERKCPTFA